MVISLSLDLTISEDFSNLKDSMILSLVFEEEQCINPLLLRLLERRDGITAISGLPAERIELFLFSQYFCFIYFFPKIKMLSKSLTVSREEISILYKRDLMPLVGATDSFVTESIKNGCQTKNNPTQ